MRKYLHYLAHAWVASFLPILLLTACHDEESMPGVKTDSANTINLSGEIEQVSVTRVNDNGFADGDVMGVYIVDYNGSNPGTLANSGNRATNVYFTFDEAAYKWNSSYDVYWKDKVTPIDVYGYYPAGSPADVNAYGFEVQKDQSTVAEGESLGGYEASDFLWGKAENVAPTTNVIRLPLRHRMSNVRVTLVEGEGFEDGAWTTLEKSVLVQNTSRQATIDLATGTVTVTGDPATTGTIPFVHDSEFRAIVVPQTVAGGKVLFSITVDGTPYTFKKEDDFTYTPGKMHNFTIKVDKKENTGDYTFTLVGESITAWENDLASHESTAKEYVVVNVEESGKLKEAIKAAGKDYKKIKNLKLQGELDPNDFYFMRDSMTVLQSLNLKEIKIKGKNIIANDGWAITTANQDDQIPHVAFREKQSLLRVVLPDQLKAIGTRAFYKCIYLTGSLIIPEGVTEIQQGAFTECKSLTGTLSLPTTLEYIGNGGAESNDYFCGTFSKCSFVGELVIPEKVKEIRGYAFNECRGLYGNINLPSKLTKLGLRAFAYCTNLTGSLKIPQGVTDIPEEAFMNSGLDGTLILHDGILTIGESAFSNCHLKGGLNLPKSLVILNSSVFSGCDLSGELKLPENLTTIGDNVFMNNWRLMGTVEIPQNVLSIGSSAFSGCRNLEGIILPEGLENIRSSAFANCYGLGSIVCKGTMPAYVASGAFDGVPKDNFTVEVPESAIAQYQTATGWSDFKRIAAHHELVCRPSTANAIGSRRSQTLVLDAEGDWEVQEMPSWCNLSQNNGSQKTELTLTIDDMAQGTGDREGDIVFKLKDKNYTAKCHVKQRDYTYKEDEVITLQKATRGNTGGINLVFLGDGYDAVDIAEGTYLTDMKEQVENFFGLEPYKTYRDYFNVYTAIALSTESGIGTLNSISYTKFETTFTGDVGLKGDYDAIFNYALQIPGVTKDNLNRSLIIVTPNTSDYGGITQLWEDGSAIAFCPKSTYGYPLDTRGVLQHEAGGHGFGKLADEYIYHNAFIDFCTCTCCGHVAEFNYGKALGWYDNLALTGKMHEVPWSHLIFDDRYSDLVDIYEGGFMHSRGVYRSEQNSCMNNDIPYYSTISRESIVKRIKQYAGETYSFEDFVANDKRDAGAVTRSSGMYPFAGSRVHSTQYHPHIHKGKPLQ